MQKKISLLLVLCLIICAFSVNVSAVETEDESTSSEETLQYVENQVIILTNTYYDSDDYSGEAPFSFNGVSITAIEPLFDDSTDEILAAWVEKVGNTYSYLITLDSSCTVSSAVETLLESSAVLTAEPNYIVTVEEGVSSDSYIIPEGPEESSNIGTDYEQSAHDYLDIQTVWDSSFTGSSAVRVAVIDVGFVEHSDLETNFDMELAYNAVDGSKDVYKNADHGNMVSGIIGADYDDGGINGLCKNVKIIPIKLGSGEDYYPSLLRGVTYAIDNDVSVINISCTIHQYSAQLVYLIEQAGILLVTSAGNDNIDLNTPNYAEGKTHNSPNWIVVGSSDMNDVKGTNSNYSSIYCDMFAPGVGIISTSNIGYRTCVGSATSYAAPHVTAACALILSSATHLTPLEVKDLLMNNVNVVEGFDELCVSGGVLSINNAINELYSEYRGVYSKGDINGDGYIKATDYLICKRILLGDYEASEIQLNAADVNFDGEVKAVDYLLMERFIYGTYYIPIS